MIRNWSLSSESNVVKDGCESGKHFKSLKLWRFFINHPTTSYIPRYTLISSLILEICSSTTSATLSKKLSVICVKALLPDENRFWLISLFLLYDDSLACSLDCGCSIKKIAISQGSQCWSAEILFISSVFWPSTHFSKKILCNICRIHCPFPRRRLLT